MTHSSAANGAMGTRDWDDDMSHVHSAQQLRDEVAAGQARRAVYGDSVGGRSFTDEESNRLIEREKKVRPSLACGWHDVWHNLHVWTLISCQPETQDEIDAYSEARASDQA